MSRGLAVRNSSRIPSGVLSPFSVLQAGLERPRVRTSGATPGSEFYIATPHTDGAVRHLVLTHKPNASLAPVALSGSDAGARFADEHARLWGSAIVQGADVYALPEAEHGSYVDTLSDFEPGTFAPASDANKGHSEIRFYNSMCTQQAAAGPLSSKPSTPSRVKT